MFLTSAIASALIYTSLISPATEARIYFYRACHSYSTNDKAGVLKYSQYTVDSFNPVPRYTHIAQLMYDEATQWRDGDVADVGRDQRIAGERMDRGVADQVTRDAQKRALDKLDRLIKQLETPPPSDLAAKPPDNPAPESHPQPDNAGKGKVDERAIAAVKAQWGKLPPLERARAIQELIGDSPPKWKAMNDEYRKSLNKSPSR